MRYTKLRFIIINVREGGERMWEAELGRNVGWNGASAKGGWLNIHKKY